MEKVCLCLCHPGIPKYRNSYNYCVAPSYHTTPGLMITHHSCIKTYVVDLLIGSNIHSFSKVIFFVKDTQSIYYLCLVNKKNSCSLCIDNSCTFCPRLAEFLFKSPISTRYVFSLYQFWYLHILLYSVFFVKDTQFIYYLRLANKTNSFSLCIDNSCTFCPHSASDFLPRVQYPHGMCSLFINSGTYTCYSKVFFVKDTQSIYYFIYFFSLSLSTG